MKNITVALDDEIYRRARVHAAERDTSVSALVKSFLVGIAGEESETERLKREEIRLRATIGGFRAADRVGRDEAHARDV